MCKLRRGKHSKRTRLTGPAHRGEFVSMLLRHMLPGARTFHIVCRPFWFQIKFEWLVTYNQRIPTTHIYTVYYDDSVKSWGGGHCVARG